MNECHDNHLLSDYLLIIQTSGLLIQKLSQVLALLMDKRATLAEKGIKTELYTCLNATSDLISLISNLMASERYKLDQNECIAIKQITSLLTEELQNFLQAANHNLNYLEQYFEHDFWLRLNDNQFARQLSEIIHKTKSNCSLGAESAKLS